MTSSSAKTRSWAKLWLAIGALSLLLLGWRLTGSDTKGSAKKPGQGSRVSAELARRQLSKLNTAFGKVTASTMGLAVVEGQVLDADTRRPIAGAEVLFSGLGGEASALCDEYGRYRIELSPGIYRAYASAENYVAVASATLERIPRRVSTRDVAMPRHELAPLLGVLRNQQNVQLHLLPAGVLHGRVIDEDGYAVAGAVIAARPQSGTRTLLGQDVTESESDGSYRLLIPAGGAFLEVNHEDFVALKGERFVSALPGEDTMRDLVLGRGCIVEGTVVNANGNLVEDGALEREIRPGVFTPIGEVHQGRFRFVTEEVGSVTLRAWPWRNTHSQSEQFECDQGTHIRALEFHIPDAAPRLTGIVRNADGSPAAGVFVDIFSIVPGGDAQQELTNEDGEFGFFALSDGPYQLSVFDRGQGMAVQLIESPSTGVEMKLSGVGTLLGTVEGAADGTGHMEFRCALEDNAAANSDQLMMPAQSILVPINGGRFRVDGVPICRVQGHFQFEGTNESFGVQVTGRSDAVISLGS